MTKITIAGVALSLAPGLSLDIDADESGTMTVYIDPYDGGDHDEPAYCGPGPTLMDLFTARNPILDDMRSTAVPGTEYYGEKSDEPCPCDECAEERKWAEGREQAIHDTRKFVLSEIGNMLTDGDLLNLARELKNGRSLIVASMTNDPAKG